LRDAWLRDTGAYEFKNGARLRAGTERPLYTRGDAGKRYDPLLTILERPQVPSSLPGWYEFR
jgi:hypothetical protein